MRIDGINRLAKHLENLGCAWHVDMSEAKRCCNYRMVLVDIFWSCSDISWQALLIKDRRDPAWRPPLIDLSIWPSWELAGNTDWWAGMQIEISHDFDRGRTLPLISVFALEKDPWKSANNLVFSCWFYSNDRLPVSRKQEDLRRCGMAFTRSSSLAAAVLLSHLIFSWVIIQRTTDCCFPHRLFYSEMLYF